jgi:hypothetical protein
MNPERKFHALFSLLMGAMMVSLMTFVITLVNLGPGPGFLVAWGKSFAIAYVVAVPLIFFLAPVARKMTAKLLGVKA